ncbi:MAG: TolC family protein [Planctomycetota bacterium]
MVLCKPIVLHGKLSMASAVLLAVGNNKGLRAVMEEKARARGRLNEAWSAVLPTLDLEASYTRVDEVGGTTFAGQQFKSGQKHSYAVDFVLRQPIFRGGAITAGIRGAKLLRHQADEQIAAATQQVVFDTLEGFYGVLLAEELVKVSRSDLDLAQAHLDEVKKKRRVGVVSQFDELRAKVEVSNVAAQLIERQNSLRLARTTLFKTLGVSQESEVDFVGELAYAKSSPDLAGSVRHAFHHRPELLQAELDVRMKREALIEAQAGIRPRLNARLTERYARPDPHNSNDAHWGEQWTAGLVLSMPLFDGWATLGRAQQARAALRQAQIELEDAEERVLLEVRQAILSVEDADKLVQSQADNVRQAQEALRLAEAGYQAGVRSELETRDARQALAEARAVYSQAVHKHEIAKLQLRRAIGTLRETDGELVPLE